MVRVKFRSSAPLMESEALQLYRPASESWRFWRERTEVLLTVPRVEKVMIFVVLGSSLEPSLNQEIIGKGIPEAEHEKETTLLTLASVSPGESTIVTFSR